MSDNEYKYHSKDSALEGLGQNFSSRLGDCSGDHEELYFGTLQVLIGARKSGALLDVGCGLGRIQSLARGKVHEIVGLEPDISRFEDCHRNHHSEPQCQIFNQTSSQYRKQNPDKRFDLIILGMVLQHVSTSVCKELLSDCEKLAKPDGIVVVSTTHTTHERRGFSVSARPDDPYMSQEEYDRYAEGPGNAEWGIPVRRFSKPELLEAVSPHFDVLWWAQYSYYRPEGLAWTSRRLGCDESELRDVGNSQFVVLQPKSR